MEIREAREEDVVEIRELVVGLSYFCLSDKEDVLPGWLLSSLELKEFEKRLQDNNYINLICASNDNIIGYISIKDKNHIYHLFVSPQYQRKGIAKNLWNRARAMCGSSTYTVRSSLNAVPVYQRFGFIKLAAVEKQGCVQFQHMQLTTD